MSNLALFEKSQEIIYKQSEKFKRLAASHKAVNFEQEASFALQALKANDFLAKTASENLDSLINAIHNIASIGLSLNPALKHAYLVPRNKKVCLDLSYKGLTHLAIDAGTLKWVQAELVYQKDNFILRGRGQEPIHERNPFDSDRGAIVGAYAIAQTIQGDFLVEVMSAKEILDIRNRTEAYKAFLEKKVKTCPWVSDEGEMFKKTVIRRASKAWPMSNKSDLRVAKAIEIDNEANSILIEKDVTPIIDKTEEKIKEVRDLLTQLNRDEAKFVAHLSKMHRRKIEALSELTDKELEMSLALLKDLVQKQKEKENDEAKEVENVES